MTLMLSKVPGLSWPLKNVRGCLEWDAHPGECVIFINSVGVLFFFSLDSFIEFIENPSQSLSLSPSLSFFSPKRQYFLPPNYRSLFLLTSLQNDARQLSLNEQQPGPPSQAAIPHGDKLAAGKLGIYSTCW